MNREFYISIISSDWQDLRKVLLTEDGKENAAVLLCGIADSPTERRLLVRKIIPVPKDKYDIREELHLRISPHFYNEIVSNCLESKLSPVIIHSHPFDGQARYSTSDDYGESRLLPVLSTLLPEALPASLLITNNDISGRWFNDGNFEDLSGLKIFGSKSRIIKFNKTKGTAANSQYDRQVRAFGEEGQKTIQEIKVGIIGVGGIGSMVAEQLARVGITDLILVDDDEIESSNISRLIGATHADVGKNKAEVISNHMQSLGVGRSVPISESAIQQKILLQLRERDLIFNCVDNDRTRAIINRFSYQYLIPVVDMGTRLDAREGKITGAAGRASVVGPNMTCLRCSHHLNPERIRTESMPIEERSKLAKEGYVMGIDDPAPSVISINTVVAGLGVTSGLNLFVDLTGGHDVSGQLYDASSGFVFTAEQVHETGCDICDPNLGVKGLGDSQIVSAY